MMGIKYIEVILKDIMEPALYLIPSLPFSAIVVIFVCRISRGRNILFSKRKGIIWILFLTYVFVVFQTAFLSREPGSRKGISLILFETWGNNIYGYAFFIENIIMFIPFGILAPILFFKMRKIQYCVLIGFLCSCAIEIIQFITQRGYCQVDDVMTNTIGTLLGWLVWNSINKLKRIIIFMK